MSVPMTVQAVAYAFALLKNDTISSTIEVLAIVEKTIIPSVLSIAPASSSSPPPDTMYSSASISVMTLIMMPMVTALMTYPPARLPRRTGVTEKSLYIFLDLSSTITPNAPIVVVTDVTASRPAIIHESII